ncbi:mandelate racemase/muconate lactonizing enzyme family protein [Candidatus Latescibacterota bacterium]
MKITGTRFFMVETPRETGSISEHVMIRIDTDEGVQGWGEVSDLAHGHPMNFPDFSLLEEEANRRLAGADPTNIGDTMQRLGGILPSAFDIGLHDLLGKILNVPVCALLGGKRRDRIPFCYPIFPLRDGDDVEPNMTRVRRVVDMGFTRIRKYIGADWEAEESFLRALRDAYGWDVEIKSLDLSGRFYWQQALEVLQRFKQYRYDMAESVARPRNDLRGMAQVRRQLGIPISEHLGSYASIFEHHQAEAVDLCNIATCSHGVRRCKALFDFAQGIGLRALHGTTQELSIGTAAAAHVCAAIEEVDMPCDPAGPILYTEDCTRHPVQYEDSCIVVPEGPGLGIDVDEEYLEEIRYKETRLKQLRNA